MSESWNDGITGHGKSSIAPLFQSGAIKKVDISCKFWIQFARITKYKDTQERHNHPFSGEKNKKKHFQMSFANNFYPVI